MKKKWLKKGSAVLLAAAMVLSLFPGMKGTLATVQAAAENTEPASEYWTDAEGLKKFGISSTKIIGKIRFGLNNLYASGLWAICGADGSNLALLSTSAFSAPYEYGNTNEYSKSNFVTNIDTYLDTERFSAGEKSKMAEVTVETNEPDMKNGGYHSVKVEDKKLYLPNSQDQNSFGQRIIYVGSSNDIAIDVKKLDDAGLEGRYWFWLRSPCNDYSNYVLLAIPGYDVDRIDASNLYHEGVWVVPAFNLKLSDVSFASAAEAASYNGFMKNDTDNTMTANTYTLRYASAGTEEAVISPDGTKIEVTGAKGKYLMVQNSIGAYALKIDSNNQTINASDIQMGTAESDKLANFNNCKVWLESTDKDRITTAKMATQAAPTQINSVALTGIDVPSAESAFNTKAACATTGVSTTNPTVTWTPNDTTAGYNTTYTASVTLTAEAGYEFASNVTATVNGQNATSVTKNQDGTVIVTYEFPATAKATPSEKGDVSKTAIAWILVIAVISGAVVLYFVRKKKTVR